MIARLIRAMQMLLWILVATSSAAVLAQTTSLRFDIPAEPLAEALLTFGRQANLSVAADQVLTAGKEGRAVQGTYTAAEALEKLLEGSGLTYQFVSASAVKVTSPRVVARTSQATSPSHPTAANDPGSTTAEPSFEVEEIVVTAQKRLERLQDVPVPVTVISGNSLNDNNLLRLQDFYARVPTLNFAMGLRGEPALAIRGMTTTWSGNPTVGIVVDDVPYGASTANGGGFTAPDIDPSDLERLEVLRGPQGTLYGASSLGGLLKFVTVDPSTRGLSGRAQAGVSNVRNGDEAGYNIRGAVNVPLSDVFAVRASGFTRRDPGYIDDPGRDAKGVNWGEASGGRLSALWQPSQTFSLKLSALMQNKDRRGSPEVDLLPGLGDLQQRTLRGTGDYSVDSRLYSVTLKARIANADLTTLTGYNDNSWSALVDNTSFCGSIGNGWSDFLGVSGCSLPEKADVRKFTQEIRLAGAASARADWLLGAFYTHEKTDWVQSYLAVDAASGESRGPLVDYVFGPTTYEEYAAFADVTLHFTDQFDVQVGGRQSHNKQKHDESGIFQVFGNFVYAPPTLRTDANASTYLVTPRLKVSKELMVYARLASGYRAGGPNILSTFGFPSSVRPDKSQNYEIGLKSDLLARRLSFDVSAYYIDWKDIQISVHDAATSFNYVANAGRAKSQGVDLTVESRPVPGLTIAGWVAWNDAKLTEALPPGAAHGVPGDRLPFSSRISGNLSVNQEFPLTVRMTGFFGGTISYVGERLGTFTATSTRQSLPSYAQIDLLTGARFDSWTVNLFVNNLADRRGVLAGGIGSSNPIAFTYIQPRTIGLSLARAF